MIKITGTIKKIFPIEKKSNNFDKRLFWFEDDDEKYKNIFQIELWKADVDMIDSYAVGDLVTLYIDLKGKQWTNADKKEFVTNSMKCWNIEKEGKLFKKI
jgi:hypothetical protein